MSVGHTPHAATFTSTSPLPISGTGNSSNRKSLAPRYTTARIVFGIFSICRLDTRSGLVSINNYTFVHIFLYKCNILCDGAFAMKMTPGQTVKRGAEKRAYRHLPIGLRVQADSEETP